jgi:hypothetical protein
MLLSDLRFWVKSTTKTIFRFINTKQLSRLRRKRRSHRNPRHQERLKAEYFIFRGEPPQLTTWYNNIMSYYKDGWMRMPRHPAKLIRRWLVSTTANFLNRKKWEIYFFWRDLRTKWVYPWSVHDMILIEKLNLKTKVVLGFYWSFVFVEFYDFFNTCKQLNMWRQLSSRIVDSSKNLESGDLNYLSNCCTEITKAKFPMI